MADTKSNAFITTKKGTCYLTIKMYRRNFEIMKIRQYKITPDDKRRMRRLHPDVNFDWKKITAQLAKKREVCRSYRSRRRMNARIKRAQNARKEPFYGVFDPYSRAVYTNDPGNLTGMGMLLDEIIAREYPKDTD